MNPAPPRTAGVVSRGVAFVIDSTLVLFVCTIGFQIGLGILAAVGAARFSGNADGSARAVGYLVALPLTFCAYCAGFWWLVGRTPGMMLLGLRVVKGDGTPPGARRSLIRAVGYWVSAIALIGFAWIAVDRRRQGFHDKLAGTFVVYDWGLATSS